MSRRTGPVLGKLAQSTLLLLPAASGLPEVERDVADEGVLVFLGVPEDLHEASGDDVSVVLVVVEPLSELEEVVAEVVSGNLGDGRLEVVASDARELLDVAVVGNVERVSATDSSARIGALEAADLWLLLCVAADSACLNLAVVSISRHRDVLCVLLVLCVFVGDELLVSALAGEVDSLVEAGVPLHSVEAVDVLLGLPESSCGVKLLNLIKDAPDGLFGNLSHEADLAPVFSLAQAPDKASEPVLVEDLDELKLWQVVAEDVFSILGLLLLLGLFLVELLFVQEILFLLVDGVTFWVVVL